ncbi:MAG: addiction module protein [Verrucomicrobia bacterium]|nr:addiction module protein [Verrucomicrobiota bacterium]
MEALWDSITHTGTEVKSPTWHKSILEKRQRKIASGKATYLTLSQLKEKLAK